MTKTPKGPVSFASLDLETAGEKAFAFDFLDAKGDPTGARFLVLSTNSRTVKARVFEIMDRYNRVRAEREMQRKKNPDAVVIDPVEEGVRQLAELAAARLEGWENVDAEFSRDLALRLCQSNPSVRDQIVEKADDAANFTTA